MLFALLLFKLLEFPLNTLFALLELGDKNLYRLNLIYQQNYNVVVEQT